MWNIALRELRSFFISPLAWSILGVVQLILSLVFAASVETYLQPNTQMQLAYAPNAPGVTDFVVSDLLALASIIMLLVTPLLTMRLISEERHNKTLPLLLSAPVSLTQIVLGKYIGLMSFFLIMLTLIMLMPFALLLGGTLDFGQIACGLLGLLLLIGAFTAIGLYISTLTAYPTVAAVSTFGVLFILWIINWVGSSSGDGTSDLLTYLSITDHYQSLLRGLFSTKDVSYYVLLIALFLILSIQRLDAERM